MTTVVVVAKECVPGRVKTRLCPALTAELAARVAQACLDDTLRAVHQVSEEVVLYFAGTRVPASAGGATVMAQCDGSLDVRLAHLLDRCTGPMLLVGMDTPQLDPAVLRRAVHHWPTEVDAWFGPATDGGFWALGLREPDGALVRGVAMSLETTGAAVRSRLVAAGLRVADLPEAEDVDTVEAAIRVAALAPGTAFAAELHRCLAVSGRDVVAASARDVVAAR